MNIVLWIVLVTAVSGIVGTGLGGFLGAILQKDSSKIVSLLLAFAGGVMLAVVCFDLLPESFKPEGAESEMAIYIVILGTLLGYMIVYLLNLWIDRRTNPEIVHIDSSHPQSADDLDELIHADHYFKHKAEEDPHARGIERRSLFIAGVVMACAIALHNMPEGMVIGASYAGDMVASITEGSGFILAIVIGLHNIPEGMAVSVPLIAGGMSKTKAIVLTGLSGAPTVLGALLGYSLGLLSPIWLTIALSFASGAMLYVVLGEIIPESFLMWRSKAPGGMALIGILVGMTLVYM